MKYKTTAEVYADKHGAPISAYANLTKSSRGDSEIAKREKSRMRAIMRGEDVESHAESMRLLGLHARWGA